MRLVKLLKSSIFHKQKHTADVQIGNQVHTVPWVTGSQVWEGLCVQYSEGSDSTQKIPITLLQVGDTTPVLASDRQQTWKVFQFSSAITSSREIS